MELKQAIEERRSIRKFKSDPLSDKAINEILESARLAPSGSNIQPARFVVVKSSDIRARLAACTPCRFIAEAPVIFVCCADSKAMSERLSRMSELEAAGAFSDTDMDVDNTKSFIGTELEESVVRSYVSMNAAIAVEHMVLRAVDLGLGSCWIGAFNRKRVREILELEGNIHVLALLPVGYPAQSPLGRPRFPLERLVLKTI